MCRSSAASSANNYVPIFSGKQRNYRECRKRCEIYKLKMELAGRGREVSYDVDEYDDVYPAYVDAKIEQDESDADGERILSFFGKKDGRKGGGKKSKGRPKRPGPGGGKGFKQMPKPGPSLPSGKGPSMRSTWALGAELSSQGGNGEKRKRLDDDAEDVNMVENMEKGADVPAWWCRPTWVERNGRCWSTSIGGTAPNLAGRPVLEKMGIAVDYGKNRMRWPDRDWHAIKAGPKGEHSLHLAEDIKELKDLIPEGAEGAAILECRRCWWRRSTMWMFQWRRTTSWMKGYEDPSQQDAVGLDAGGLESSKISGTEKETKAKSKHVKFVGACTDENSSIKMRKLTTPMLRKMIRQAEDVVSGRNKMLRMARTCEKGKPVRKIWELFVGEGRTSKFLDKMNGVESRVFSIQNGWNLKDKDCQKKFMELPQREELDEILMAPMCPLWSPMQELYACRGEWEN